MATRSIKTKFEVDGEQAYKNSLKSINQTLSNVKVGFLAVSAAVVGVYEGYKKLIDLTTEYASKADSILTLSQITGFDTQSIQELQYASELIDVSFDTIKGSITKLTNNMQTAQSGTGAMADSFRALGVEVTNEDGTLRNAEATFYDAIDALGKIENATERDAIAMDLFGKSAQELNPLIEQGTETLEAYREEALAVGAVLTGEQLEALGEVDNAYQRLQQTQEAVKQQMAAEMAPVVEEFYKAWTNFMSNAGKALIDSHILENLMSILDTFVRMVDSMTDAEGELPLLADAFKILGGVLGTIARMAASFMDLLNALKSLRTLDFKGVADSFGWNLSRGVANNAQRVKMQQLGTWDQYAEYYGYNASGDSNFRGGLTWVGEAGAELVSLPQGSQILSNQDSRNLGGDTYNITIDAKSVKEFNDIVNIAKSQRVTTRMRG